MPRPHNMFKYIRADEVAECWDGVTKELYIVLWNKIVPRQKALREHIDVEESAPQDAIGLESLASHWEVLSLEEQEQLNKLAEEESANAEADYQDMIRSWRP